MKRKFKAGDEVKVISNKHGDKDDIGRTGVIGEFFQYREFPFLVRFNDSLGSSDSCEFADYELELVEKYQVPAIDEIPHNQVQVYKDGKLQWVHILDIRNYNLGYNEEEVIKRIMSKPGIETKLASLSITNLGSGIQEFYVNGVLHNPDLKTIKDNDVNMYNILIQQIKMIAEQFKKS